MTGISGDHVAVTGGAGFIGSHLTERLAALGPRRLTVVDDLSTGSLSNLQAIEPDIELIIGDICSDDAAAALAQADLVFHLAVRNVRASISKPIANFAVNAAGTLRVLDVMRQGRQGRFVYISSSEVYGIPAAAEFGETTLPAPTTVYGAGKLAGELVTLAYHRTYGMDTRVIRPFNNFGPWSHFEGDSGEVIPKFVLRSLAGRPLIIHGDGTQTRDFMYVEETASWLVRLADVPALQGETLNIGSGTDVSIGDLAAKVLELTGSRSPVVYEEPRPGDLPRLRADVSRAQALAGFRLDITFEEGLRRTIDYFAGSDIEGLLATERPRTWEDE